MRITTNRHNRGGLYKLMEEYADGGVHNEPPFDPNDPEFLSYLRATNQEWHEEYSGDPLKAGGGEGSFRDISQRGLAVNPDSLPQGTSDRYQSEVGPGSRSGGPGSRGTTMGDYMSNASNRYAQNRKTEAAYKEWLSRKPNRRPQPKSPSFEQTEGPHGPGSGGYRVIHKRPGE